MKKVYIISNIIIANIPWVGRTPAENSVTENKVSYVLCRHRKQFFPACQGTLCDGVSQLGNTYCGASQPGSPAAEIPHRQRRPPGSCFFSMVLTTISVVLLTLLKFCSLQTCECNYLYRLYTVYYFIIAFFII